MLRPRAASDAIDSAGLVGRGVPASRAQQLADCGVHVTGLGDRVAGLPEHLRDTDLFTLDSATLAEYGVIAFAPGYPLWSDGAGKLLSLASGEPSTESGFEVRFAKPQGTSYVDLYARLQPWSSLPGVSLWRRMMVLGPPPEFCLVTPSEVDLPAEMNPERLARVPI